ncbi:septation protein A [Methylobacterium sp. E-045]|uniref:septation protein A n=1 Tax=Methylobacterium sp. E-045 TaxID=2836575 RepID=UPI001FBB7F8B|nr:septation protein A [Methylobacterium sp. E-045]MCJ2130463.1 septation protein A [Methylobacterium sp. E-045]
MTLPVESVPPRRHLAPVPKLALEMGPLVLFFLLNSFGTRFGLSEDSSTFLAIGVFVVATAVALAIHFAVLRRLPIMPLVSGIVVLVFGGMALALHDKTFFVIKPTIVNALFGTILLGGLLFGKSLLSVVLDSVFDLTDEGWRKLTFRWGVFFLALAAINEVVWRTQSYAFWANFKVVGIMPLTILFALSQTPLLLRYDRKEGAKPEI